MFKFGHTITIKIKNGKYKYEISDFTWSDGHVDQNIEHNYNSITKKSDYKYLDEHVNKKIELLEQAIKMEINKDDNW